MLWLLRRFGFDAWLTVEDGTEHYNMRVPDWVARRPRLVNALTDAAVKAIREEE